MSKTFDDLVHALEANTAAVIEHNKRLDAMLKTAGASKPAAGAPAAAGTGKPAAGKPGKPAAMTVEKAGERATKFAMTGDDDERAERKSQLKAISAHYGAPKFTAIPGDKLAEACSFLDMIDSGELPDFMQAEEEEEESPI